ncbi:UDP-N-acetylmuramoyl-L-alanyl-D-glutamate--2, 6-diaminopimelate ligase [Sinobacterium norvegicum]|uniref:UDP-N-acetylmuramoyl-L-alanyl-D-glutamate--2,6-diaminopimelate ligase n=2 Tax=Sinobacterium norvegicum TaxID=1641715 RepID=A0ABM9AJF2_9GAMM|nr:UDP-N-acetylmuramoyl-L-alanyl-D-glutamate--2, 6-diaminopimelate ligase [Sinobacterium norvegicum]
MRKLSDFMPQALVYSDMAVTGMTLDSRHVEPGFLFVALAGRTVDGRQYIDSAQRAGAVAVLVEDSAFEAGTDITIPMIKVPNLAERLAEIAQRFYRSPFQSLSVVGVTGTNGKTSCSQLVMQLLHALGNHCAVLGTTGWGVGAVTEPSTHTTPDTVSLQAIGADLVARGATALAMEISSHALDQGRIDGVEIDTAVFTNLSRDHLDYHISMEAYGEAKRRLFGLLSLKNAVVNIDDAFGQAIVAKLNNDVRLLSYSLLDSTATLYVRALSYSLAGVSGVLCYDNQECEFTSPLIGEFNVSNLLAAIAAVLADGYSLTDIVPHIGQLKPARGRLEVVTGAHNITVMIDYAHTPDALEQVLKSVKKHCQQSLWVVFGCGGDRDKGKRPLMARAAQRFADRLVITSDNPRTETPAEIVADVVAGIKVDKSVTVEVERQRAIELAVSQAKPGDCVLIAGKGHETYQDIMGVKHDFDDFEKVTAALAMRGEI